MGLKSFQNLPVYLILLGDTLPVSVRNLACQSKSSHLHFKFLRTSEVSMSAPHTGVQIFDH